MYNHHDDIGRVDRVEVSRGYDMNIFDEIWYCPEIPYHVELYPPNSVPSSRAFSISISSLTVAFRDCVSLNHRWRASSKWGSLWNDLTSLESSETDNHLVLSFKIPLSVVRGIWRPSVDWHHNAKSWSVLCGFNCFSRLASLTQISPSDGVCWGFETSWCAPCRDWSHSE